MPKLVSMWKPPLTIAHVEATQDVQKWRTVEEATDNLLNAVACLGASRSTANNLEYTRLLKRTHDVQVSAERGLEDAKRAKRTFDVEQSERGWQRHLEYMQSEGLAQTARPVRMVERITSSASGADSSGSGSTTASPAASTPSISWSSCLSG